jgi:hypothetical protein
MGIGTSKAALIVLRPHTGDEIIIKKQINNKYMSNSKKAFPKCWIQHRQILPILMEENTYTLNSKVRNAEHAIVKFPRLRDRERRPASDDVSPIGRLVTNRLVPPPGNTYLLF